MNHVDGARDAAATEDPTGSGAEGPVWGQPSPSPDEVRVILRSRARALARRPTEEPDASEALTIVEFALADQRFGVPLSAAREVYVHRELTPIPCTPPFVRGIVNVRGRLLAVIDLSTILDLGQPGSTNSAGVIIVGNAETSLGLVVDEVLGVRSIPLAAIQPPTPTISPQRAAHLSGITNDRVAILDVGKLMADEQIVVHEEVAG